MLFVPRGVDPGGPKPDDLSDVRITQVEYRDGTADAIRDNWRERGECAVAPKVRDMWIGTTWFILRGSDEVAGPARKRMRVKGIPAATKEELEIMKKLRTGAGIDRGALVVSLSVAGIERMQLAAAQRRCKDFAMWRSARRGRRARVLARW